MTVALETPRNHRQRYLEGKTARLSRYKHKSFVKRLVSEADAIYYPPLLDEAARHELFAEVCRDTCKSSLMQEFFLFQKTFRWYNKKLKDTSH